MRLTEYATSMNKVLTLLLTVCAASLAAGARAQVPSTENVILITVDGLRWQEVFGGADERLIRHEAYVENPDDLAARFWANSETARRRRLMPFMWDSVATQGVIYGNRRAGSRADVSNTHVFSYPGYNEILTGFADDTIDSNDKVPNSNVTVLEWLNLQPEMQGRIAAYASWDVFPYIINEERSQVPVNAGFEPVRAPMSQTESVINGLQTAVDTPWEWERFDAFTHYLALEYLVRMRPRLLYVAYGDTDEYAHAEDYAAYLNAANRFDGFLAHLWNWVQATDGYRDRTTFVITTDHGRGEGDRWIGHGADWEGSEEIWIAILGPDTPAHGEFNERSQLFQNQIAATVASLLGYNYTNERPVGEPIEGAARYE